MQELPSKKTMRVQASKAHVGRVLSLESQSKSMEPAKVELNQPITATGRNQGSEAGSHEAMLRYILNIGVPAIKLPSSSPVSKLAVNAASLGRRCPTLSIKVGFPDLSKLPVVEGEFV